MGRSKSTAAMSSERGRSLRSLYYLPAKRLSFAGDLPIEIAAPPTQLIGENRCYFPMIWSIF
jgi:hypothetical protein